MFMGVLAVLMIELPHFSINSFRFFWPLFRFKDNPIHQSCFLILGRLGSRIGALYALAATVSLIPMRKPILIILFALASVIVNATAGSLPIGISLAIPTHNGMREIENTEYQRHIPHFPVIIANSSDSQQRLWREWCSWGYFGLTFEFTDESGKKWIAKKEEQVWTKNFPDWWTLEPHESLVIDVNFADTNTWVGFPSPTNGSQTVTMQAILEFKPNDVTRQYGIWTGRVVSKAEKVTFYHWTSDTK